MKTRITELLDIQFPIIQGGMAWVAEHHLAAAVSDAGGLGIIGAGADAVVAEGMESGGHIGAQTTMCLVPQVVDAVQIPVIVAGGIADGRGMAAAFMLGAEAVQMGTRFIVCRESVVHANYKNKILKAKDIDSEVTGTSHGHPVRQLRNNMTREYLKLEKEGASFEELEKLTLGALRKAVVDGDTINGTLMAGQLAGLVKKEQTCKEMIEEIMCEAMEGWCNRTDQECGKRVGESWHHGKCDCPGFIETEMTEGLSDSVKEALKDQTLLKRTGKAEEVAQVAVFLASEGADYITGQVISVDGGMAV